jgi:hypothetical protein
MIPASTTPFRFEVPMAEVWLTKTLAGLRPADAESEAIIGKIPIGNTFPADVPVRKSRSGSWHRRYWALMHMLGTHCSQVEVEPGLVLPIRNKDDAHVAMKYATGLFDSYAIKGGVVRMVKSTSFDAMTPDEWAAYWKRVLDAVHEKFLPGVEARQFEDEIARLAS